MFINAEEYYCGMYIYIYIHQNLYTINTNNRTQIEGIFAIYFISTYSKAIISYLISYSNKCKKKKTGIEKIVNEYCSWCLV